MARIAGVELPDTARIDYALTLLYGVGWPLSKKVLETVNIPQNKNVKELTDEELNHITKVLGGIIFEGELHRQTHENIQRLISIGAYRGLRHQKNLPVKGQRTRTNARTKRGKRKTVGAFKKEAMAKMQARESATQTKQAPAKK